eukprot:TRINITY_DN1671_c0_g2_i1.p1 TRINITY_DN1671_c0_g2~~TRINITY_DN1671_c0_g2_i1.p1  ORF type:complete len:518 (-),score=100.73 TRINITY_DN1671_c0_g2_i1:168-1721(-)
MERMSTRTWGATRSETEENNKAIQIMIQNIRGEISCFADDDGSFTVLSNNIAKWMEIIDSVKRFADLVSFQVDIICFFKEFVEKKESPVLHGFFNLIGEDPNPDTLISCLKYGMECYMKEDVSKVVFKTIVTRVLSEPNNKLTKFLGPKFCRLYQDLLKCHRMDHDEDHYFTEVRCSYELDDITPIAVEIFLRLFKKKNLKTSSDFNNFPAIHWVAKMGLENSLKVLLKDWSPEWRSAIDGETGNTPLHACVSHPIGCAKCIELLLKGSPVEYREMKNYSGETALHIAACVGNVEGVRILLQGASSGFRDILDEEGKKALDYSKNDAIIDLLLGRKKKKRRRKRGKGKQTELKLRDLINALQCIQKGDYKESTKVLIRAISSCTPTMKAELIKDQKLELESFVIHCHNAMKNKDFPIALSLANIGIWLFEDNEEMFVFHLIKAKINRQTREFDYAHQDCLNCLKIKKNCAMAYFEMGMCFMLEGEELKEAEKAFKKCLKLDRTFIHAENALKKLNQL